MKVVSYKFNTWRCRKKKNCVHLEYIYIISEFLFNEVLYPLLVFKH